MTIKSTIERVESGINEKLPDQLVGLVQCRPLYGAYCFASILCSFGFHFFVEHFFSRFKNNPEQSPFAAYRVANRLGMIMSLVRFLLFGLLLFAVDIYLRIASASLDSKLEQEDPLVAQKVERKGKLLFEPGLLTTGARQNLKRVKRLIKKHLQKLIFYRFNFC